MGKASRLVVSNVIGVSDLHCGCKMALCPKTGVHLDDGGEYMPSAFQRKVYRWWDYFWEEWVPRVTRGEPYAVVMNGDPLDGVHHNSVSQISHNLVDQARIAKALLKPIVEKCEGRFYMIRGTEAHGGKSGQEEERLAEELGAIPGPEGRFARYELWKLIGPPDKRKCGLAHFMHHIGTTGVSAYESTAVHKELTEAYVEAGRWGDRPPDAVVRSHRHRFIRTEISAKNGRAFGVVTPAWQGKTPFAHRIAGARQSPPQFGGILLRSGDEEMLYLRQWVQKFTRPDAE